MTKFFVGDFVYFLSESYEEDGLKENYTLGIIIEDPQKAGGEVTSNILDQQGNTYTIYLDHQAYGPVSIARRYESND